jgi:hypothetical protein
MVPVAGGATIGSELTLEADRTIAECPSGTKCAYIDFAGQLPRFLPENEVITKWRVKTGAAGVGGDVTLKLFSTSLNGFAAVASSTQETLTVAGVNTYETRIPTTSQARIFGVENSTGAPIFAEFGHTVRYQVGGVADGAEGTFTTSENNRHLLVNVDVEPDADKDGYGDVTQDGCPTDGATQGPCQADLELRVETFDETILQATTRADIQYEINVLNKGTSETNGIVLTHTVPADVKVTRAVYYDLGAGINGCEGEAPTITCPTGTGFQHTYGTGAEARFPITLVVSKPGTLTSTASATSALPDPNAGNNTATFTVPVVKAGPCKYIIQGTEFADELARRRPAWPAAASRAARRRSGSTRPCPLGDETSARRPPSPAPGRHRAPAWSERARAADRPVRRAS